MPAAKSSSNWDNVKLNDSEKTVLAKAINQGKNVYGFTVRVQETCILKAARAFLVFKAIEEVAEIMGVKESTVRSQFLRGKGRLVEILRCHE